VRKRKRTSVTIELHRLEEALCQDHLTVFMDVGELLNLGDIQYTDLLVLLGLAVFRVARQAGFGANEKMVAELRFWYMASLCTPAR
jgi:hypothetical protein